MDLVGDELRRIWDDFILFYFSQKTESRLVEFLQKGCGSGKFVRQGEPAYVFRTLKSRQVQEIS